MSDYKYCPHCDTWKLLSDFIALPSEGEFCIDCANEIVADFDDIDPADFEGSENYVDCMSCDTGFDYTKADVQAYRDIFGDVRHTMVCPHCGALQKAES